jgi:hypothetical protein
MGFFVKTYICLLKKKLKNDPKKALTNDCRFVVLISSLIVLGKKK